MRQVFLAIFLLSILNSFCQRIDTTRQYIYETSRKSWVLTVRNNKTFFFKDNKFLDSLSGRLEKNGNEFLFVVDTSNFDKFQRQVFHQFVTSLRLAFYEPFKAPVVFSTPEAKGRLNGKSYTTSPTLFGTYSSRDGFGGYGITIKERDTIAFCQWTDVGGKEPDHTNNWTMEDEVVQVLGNNLIASWVTDNGRLYVLPYLLIGRKTTRTKGKHIETYRYFIKVAD